MTASVGENPEPNKIIYRIMAAGGVLAPAGEHTTFAPLSTGRGQMNVGYLKVERRIQPRRASVLRKLGISNLVNTSMFDLSAAHEALVRRQAVPERIMTDGLVVDVPAGVYHPLPDSSSEFFIRNIKAMDPNAIAKTLEIGCGSGILSLYIASNWTSRTVATDISPIAVEATIANAKLNNVNVTAFQSDLFEKIDEKDFALIVFNTPLV